MGGWGRRVLGEMLGVRLTQLASSAPLAMGRPWAMGEREHGPLILSGLCLCCLLHWKICTKTRRPSQHLPSSQLGFSSSFHIGKAGRQVCGE